MKRLIIIIVFATITILSNACEEYLSEPYNEGKDTTIVAFKPNLYLYPTKEINLSVKIVFPIGGQLIESIPHYFDGWNITAEPNGLINKTFSYLFYEYRVPDLHQMDFGWIIKKNELKIFFEENMKLSGFNEIEIKDFTDYWIPLLNDYDYYEIYPQYKSTLNQMTEIVFSTNPDNFYRLQYLIKGCGDNKINLQPPIVEIADRTGFHALEWGVILK